MWKRWNTWEELQDDVAISPGPCIIIIMDNIVLYPKTIRMMTRSNKFTHKMRIIGRFTMPRILRSFIDCVSTLQLWTSHILYERLTTTHSNTFDYRYVDDDLILFYVNFPIIVI